MPRPDEGLIHAWLDGQLPPEEASRIERLVATDPEWAAAAAEARGLMAATSRILSALDHVPAGVIPGQKVLRAPRRMPWWTKVAAAVALMAGGTVLVMQRASTPVLSEADEKQTAMSVTPPSTPSTAPSTEPSAARKDAATTAERAQIASKPPAPVTGVVQNVNPRVREAMVEPKRVAVDSDVQMMRRARRTEPSSPAPAGNVIASMRGVTAPTPAAVSQAAPAELEARRVADQAPAAKMTLDVRQKDAPSAAAAAAPLTIPALERTAVAARRISETIGGVASKAGTTCYQVRDARLPSDPGVIMRAARTDGDTLRLEPAQGTSALRAWIVWRGDAGHGAMTPSADGKGAVAVVAVRASCPAP